MVSIMPFKHILSYESQGMKEALNKKHSIVFHYLVNDNRLVKTLIELNFMN